MKKNIIVAIAVALLVTSCGTYAGSGAANGAYFGSLLGSAIGGINGGYRGHEMGKLVGLAGGALVGAAIGDAKDKAVQRDRQQYLEEKARLKANRDAREARRNNHQDFSYQQVESDEMIYDADGTYDDRIDIDFGDGTTDNVLPASVSSLEVRNLRFIDEGNDELITRGECCEIQFEIFNHGDGYAYAVEPTVLETTGNKHILVSPTILIESIAPHKGVRYTARVVADRMLKNGTAQFTVKILENGTAAASAITFNIPTRK